MGYKAKICSDFLRFTFFAQIILFWQVLSLTGGWAVHEEEEEPLGDDDDDDEDKDKVHSI
jgi:hypothetical protein